MPPGAILIHEYVTGGGYAPLPDVPSLCGEGDAMLRAVLEDFFAWGRARIVTTRDRRLGGPPLPADAVFPLSPEDFSESFFALAAKADAVMIIAPEEGGILADMSEKVLLQGAGLLGSLPEGVRLAADKGACHKIWRGAGLPQPETAVVPGSEARAAALAFGFPLVLKTVDGQGSLGVCLATDEASLDKALAHLPPAPSLLLQRYHDGTHASVSFLVSPSGVLPLCANRQRIAPGVPFSYHGGETPFTDHPGVAEAVAVATKAVEAIPGLRGFVGVDMVLYEEGCLLIEINPRITVAYTGVRRVVEGSLAGAIVAACLDGVLPKRMAIKGRMAFNPRENRHG